jgi:trimeric autotransporter adhesin
MSISKTHERTYLRCHNPVVPLARLMSIVHFTVVTLMAQSYTVATVAGSDPVRDGGAAQNAIIQNAVGLAVDAAGNLYIADAASNRIRKVIPDQMQQHESAYALGKISTVVGLGGPYFNGDGGPATQAHLSGPYAIAFAPDGSLYVADTNNNRIRQVTVGGIIQTVAGTGEQSSGVDGGQAVSTPIILPMGVAVDGDGNLYFSELMPASSSFQQGLSSARIRRVSAGGAITTYAGGGQLDLEADGASALTAHLMPPVAIAMDGSGTLWIAETARHTVRKVNPDGRIARVAGTGVPGQTGDGGPAIQAQLNSPRAVAVDQSGNLYIGDSGNRVVRRVSPDGTIQSIFPPLAPVSGLAIDGAGNLFIAFGSQLNLWMPAYNTSLGSPIVGDTLRGRDRVPAVESLVISPTSVAGDTVGNLYIAEPFTDRIRVVDPSGVINTFAGEPGVFSGDGGRAVAATLNSPIGVAVDRAGTVWIADTGNNRIRRVTADGIIRTVAGNGRFGTIGDDGPATEAELANPLFIVIDAAGNLFLTEPFSNRIRQVTPDGVIRTIAGNGQPGSRGDGGPATSAQLSIPSELAVDGNGNLYFVDQSGQRIRQVSAEGIITTVVETRAARCIAVDLSGDLVICEGNTIGRISGDGSIEHIAGGAVPGYAGDGGPALDAQFNAPTGLWVDEAGAIYVVDQGNHRIRKLTPVVP